MAREARRASACGGRPVTVSRIERKAGYESIPVGELPPLRDATAAAIRLSLGKADHDLQPRDWSRVLAVACAERLAVIAWFRSGEYIRTMAPKQVVASWRAAAFRADDVARVQGSRLCELVTSLQLAGLHPVVLKGLPLAERLYGYAAARLSCDIDLYIPAEEREAAHGVVCGRGWRCWSGQAPWDAAYLLSDDGRMLYLELHSTLGGDLLTHCGPLPMLTDAWEYNGNRLTVVSAATLPAYLAANLVKHTPVPLISCLDFATLWNGFDDGQRRAAYTLARSARLRRYLTWAIRQGIAVIEAARGDDQAMRRLGVAPDERRAAHGHLRLLWLADSPVDAARVLGTWLLPRPMRSSLRLARSFWSNRLRGSLSGKLIQRRSHAPNAHTGEYGGPSVIDRMVESSLVSHPSRAWNPREPQRTS